MLWLPVCQSEWLIAGDGNHEGEALHVATSSRHETIISLLATEGFCHLGSLPTLLCQKT